MPDDLSNLSDGTYGRELGRISPEGNVYGTTRWVRDVLRNFWWNGAEWLEIGEDIGQSNSVALLPTTPQDPDTVWRCLDRYETDRSRYIWKYFFWDAESQSWQPIQWFWTVDSTLELPNNPWMRGQAHEVKEPDVQAMWDGYTWRRIRISSLDDDIGIISTLDMYGGTLRGLSPEVELIYISPTELTLKPINSDFEYVTINGVVVDSSKRTSVYSFSPVLSWWDETESFSTSLIQHSTPTHNQEYWVYLANKDDAFNLPPYDFRGKLFCSESTPFNNRLGKLGTAAYNAVLIGKCQTAIPNNETDRVEFLYELDVSIISKAADLKETFREFSDFDVIYDDENTLRLERIYATMGQIYIGGTLYYLGESIDLTTSDTRIIATEDGLLEFDYTDIAQDQIYYVYIASNSDIYNDNEINTEHNRPWHAEDDGAGDGLTGPYYANKDLRLKMFLSTKTPEEGRLAETWRGYFTRHIGQVSTEGTGRFVYSSAISSIRQPTLNPTYFDGLAEIDITTTEQTVSIIRKTGTSGILMVGSDAVQTFDPDSDQVHQLSLSSFVYEYDPESSLFLSPTQNEASYYTSDTIQIYMVGAQFPNESLRSQAIWSIRTPSKGYLDSSWPGNTVRWICSVAISSKDIGLNELENPTFISNDGWQNLAEESDQSDWYRKTLETSVYHNSSGSRLPLVNDAVIESGELYRISLEATTVTSGYVDIFGDSSMRVSSAGDYSFITRPSSTSFSIIPSSFNGSLKNIVCEKILTSQISGGAITSTIVPTQVRINDSEPTNTSVFSAQKVMDLINSLYIRVSAGQAFEAQKITGLPLTITNAGSKYARIVPNGGTKQTIIFPDGSTRDVPVSGIVTPQVDGTLEYAYVWLSPDDCIINQTSPSAEYENLFVLNNYVLVAYLLDPKRNNSNISAIPTMYSSITAPYVINANIPTVDVGYYERWMMFDGTDRYWSGDRSWCFKVEDNVGYKRILSQPCIDIYTGSSVRLTANGISLKRYHDGGFSPRAIALAGSNDGILWTELDYIRGITYDTGGWSQIYRNGNASAYQHYRMFLLDIPLNRYPSLQEITILGLEQDSRYLKYRNIFYPITNFYHGPSGTLNLSNQVCTAKNITASSFYDSQSDPAMLFEVFAEYAWDESRSKDTSEWRSKYAPTISSPQSIMFDFGVGNEKCINKYKIRESYDRMNNKPQTWAFQGSNDDGVSASSDAGWTTISDVASGLYVNGQFMLDTYTCNNSTKYRYYRLRITKTFNNGTVSIQSLYLIDDPLAVS